MAILKLFGTANSGDDFKDGQTLWICENYEEGTGVDLEIRNDAEGVDTMQSIIISYFNLDYLIDFLITIKKRQEREYGSAKT